MWYCLKKGFKASVEMTVTVAFNFGDDLQGAIYPLSSTAMVASMLLPVSCFISHIVWLAIPRLDGKNNLSCLKAS